MINRYEGQKDFRLILFLNTQLVDLRSKKPQAECGGARQQSPHLGVHLTAMRNQEGEAGTSLTPEPLFQKNSQCYLENESE